MTITTITWFLATRDGRIWHSNDPARLRAWVESLGGRDGREPRRSSDPYGYPVPREFRHR